VDAERVGPRYRSARTKGGATGQRWHTLGVLLLHLLETGLGVDLLLAILGVELGDGGIGGRRAELTLTRLPVGEAVVDGLVAGDLGIDTPLPELEQADEKDGDDDEAD